MKWDGVEEIYKPRLVKGVPLLGDYLFLLGRLMDSINPPKSKLMVGGQVVAYLVCGAGGLGFGSFLWGKIRLA